MVQQYNTADNTIPKIYETDEAPFAKKIIHQIWMIPSVNFIWCVAELDSESDETFGYVNLNDDEMAECRYISITDIRKNGAKLIPSEPMSFLKASKIL